METKSNEKITIISREMETVDTSCIEIVRVVLRIFVASCLLVERNSCISRWKQTKRR